MFVQELANRSLDSNHAVCVIKCTLTISLELGDMGIRYLRCICIASVCRTQPRIRTIRRMVEQSVRSFAISLHDSGMACNRHIISFIVRLSIVCLTSCLLGTFTAVISNTLELLPTSVLQIAYFLDEIRYFGLDILRFSS